MCKHGAFIGNTMKHILDLFIQWLGIPQNTDEFKWTRTKAYAKRIEWIKNTWILAGIIMLIVAQPAFILASSLFLSCLSFAFLEK